jgi:hypothetical protein
VLIAAVATSGSVNTTIYLYPPGGGLPTALTGADRLEFQLNATGTWTIEIEDSGLDTPGGYNIALLNVTAGPWTTAGDLDGGSIIPATPVAGQANPIADFDGFRFYGQSGDMAQIAAVATSGLLNTQISLYPPGGGPAVVSTSADNVSQTLAATGLYTIVIEDVGLNDTGTYNLTLTGSGTTGTPEGETSLPKVMLFPASPSPFVHSTRLSFGLAADAPVQLRVFDASGALVRTLVDAGLSSGVHEVSWDGRNDQGEAMSSGVYYLHFVAGREVKKASVVRVR